MENKCANCDKEMSIYDRIVGYDDCEVCNAREWFNTLDEADKWNLTINSIKHYNYISDSEIIDLYNKNS